MYKLVLTACIVVLMAACNIAKQPENADVKIGFLHQETAESIWYCNTEKKINKNSLPALVKKLNKSQEKSCSIENIFYPNNTDSLDVRKNTLFDYYDLWVQKSESNNISLESLTNKYDIISIVFATEFSKVQHVEFIDSLEIFDSTAYVDSPKRTLLNYKVQFEALKTELNKFPDTKFIVWTAPPLAVFNTNYGEAKFAHEISEWMIHVWDEPSDNIFIFDYRTLGTGDEVYLNPEYSIEKRSSVPNDAFAQIVANEFVNFIKSIY